MYIDKKELYQFIPGFIMGIVRAFISHPFEILKLKRQMNMSLKINKSIFKGLHLSVVSNSIERGIQFYIYEKNIKNHNILFSSFTSSLISTTISLPYSIILLRKNVMLKDIIVNKKTIFKGACMEYTRNLSGSFLFLYSYNKLKTYEYPLYVNSIFASTFVWVCTYPLDNIKNQIIAENKIVYTPRFLYKGIQYPIIRSIPSSTIGFYVYEYTKNYLNNI